MGEILLYFYVYMFLWKDFLMGQINKIQIYVFLQQTRNSTKPNLIITSEHARATITAGQRIVSFTNRYSVGLHDYFTGQIST
jgi:hypothetical protein